MNRRLVAPLASLTLALTGCQAEVLIDDGDGTSTSSTMSSTTSGTASTGTGLVCEGFGDSDGLTSVTVKVRNVSGFDVFIPAGCSGAPVLQITPAGGPDGKTYGYDESCLQTCADLQKEPLFACGACAPASILVPSGTERTFVWDGTALSTQSMPPSCWYNPNEAGTCVSRVAAAPQPYAFEVTGFAQCDGGGVGCACDAGGNCAGYPSGQQAWANPAKIAFPQENQVDILFDICAFGCAEPFED